MSVPRGAITRRPVSLDSRVTSHTQQERISSRVRAALAMAAEVYDDSDLVAIVNRVQSEYPEVTVGYLKALFATHRR